MWETVLVLAIVLGAGAYVLLTFSRSLRKGGGDSPCSFCPCPGKGDPDAPPPCSAIMERGGRYGQPGGAEPSCRKWCLKDKRFRSVGKEKAS